MDKIIFFTPYFHPYISGITQYPFRLLSSNKFKYKTRCLTFKYDSNLSSEEVINDRLTILRMPYLFRISKGFISVSSLFTFWTEAILSNIIMINLPSIEGIMLALYAKLLKKHLIVFLHCEVLLPRSFINGLINFILNCGVWFQLLLADKIIVETKDYFENKWPYLLFRDKIIEVLPLVNNVTQDNEFLCKLNNWRKEYKHVVGFCGRIAAEKGIEILINSISQLKDTALLLAGPSGKDVVGEEPYFKKIQDLLEKSNIPYSFLGTLSDDKLSSFYKSIDVLVLPSLNKTEAFGMVQVEAMLQGTPVIASNLPGVRIPIHMSHMGVVVTPGNSSELNQALLTVLSDRSTYCNPQLIHKAKLLFDPQKSYDSIYRVIQSIL